MQKHHSINNAVTATQSAWRCSTAPNNRYRSLQIPRIFVTVTSTAAETAPEAAKDAQFLSQPSKQDAMRGSWRML
jgi:hypothetical protein